MISDEYDKKLSLTIVWSFLNNLFTDKKRYVKDNYEIILLNYLPSFQILYQNYINIYSLR